MPSASFQIGFNGGEVRGVNLWDFSRTKRSQLFIGTHSRRLEASATMSAVVTISCTTYCAEMSVSACAELSKNEVTTF
jgi:hypothetical protein